MRKVFLVQRELIIEIIRMRISTLVKDEDRFLFQFEDDRFWKYYTTVWKPANTGKLSKIYKAMLYNQNVAVKDFSLDKKEFNE